MVFGTAVGGAVIHNGEIYRGIHHCAGEVSFTLKSVDCVMTDENLFGNNFGAVSFQKNCAEILGKSPDEVTGEFVARGYNIMKGYYKMPKATAAAIDKDGWLHTSNALRSGKICTRRRHK